MHWTYEHFEPHEDLEQGDILEPTVELQSILSEVHKHFLDPKYIAFLITTQSCDLVLRKNACGTRYVNIAVVRELEAVLDSFLSQLCNPIKARIYPKELKGVARLMIERLFNQNEQSLGLFYLHPDIEAGISVRSVALLRVSVAFKSDHYEVLKRARRGRLKSEFRNKLGWLVGNLYSRIGTEDWTEPSERKKDLEKLIKECLEINDPHRGPIWIPQSWIESAQKNGIDIEEVDQAELVDIIGSYKPRPPRDVAIDQIEKVIRDVVSEITDDKIRQIKHRLNNDIIFSKSFKNPQ